MIIYNIWAEQLLTGTNYFNSIIRISTFSENRFCINKLYLTYSPNNGIQVSTYNDKRSNISKKLQFICETANTKESEVINGYKSHVYKREDILTHEQAIAMN